MSLRRHKLRRKRDGYLPVSGSVIESDPTPTDSLLAQNTATPTPGTLPSGVPLLPITASQNLSASEAQTSTPTPTPASTSSSPSSSDQISMATVIGACVAALIALLFSILLAFYCSKRHKKFIASATSRNAVNNVSRRRSHLEPWKQIRDGGDQNEGQEQSTMQRPLSGPLGAMFRRTNSNSSGEKSSMSNNRESVGTMQNFAKYHPSLAAEMALQGAIKSVDGEVNIAKPAPVLRFLGRSPDMTPPVSLDGDTLGTDSFFSTSSMSPLMMAIERSTPPAVTSSLHHWESAQVLHANEISPDFSDTGELQNPFSDKASLVDSRRKSENPFFSAREHPVRRTLPPDTHENPFADTNTPDSSKVFQSLLAALEAPKEQDKGRIISVDSSVYSRAMGEDSDSAISVTAFPSPPIEMEPC